MSNKTTQETKNRIGDFMVQYLIRDGINNDLSSCQENLFLTLIIYIHNRKDKNSTIY